MKLHTLLLDVINHIPYISPYVPSPLRGPTTQPNQKKKQLWNRIKITQSKHRKSGGIQLQSEKDKSYQPSCTISVSLSLMGCILQPNLVSVISLEVRVFQWPLKESMHHLCDSLFTFINLSQK